METVTRKWQARNKRDLIIEVWEALDCESVGAGELKEIQRALRELFGAGAGDSPAAIARVVADEGAVLRHAEVFACDREWREEKLAESIELKFETLADAIASMQKVEAQRMTGEAQGLTTLRATIGAARRELLLRGRAKVLTEASREEAKEIASWLAVWLQAPELFSDWLQLRTRSEEFMNKFMSDNL